MNKKGLFVFKFGYKNDISFDVVLKILVKWM